MLSINGHQTFPDLITCFRHAETLMQLGRVFRVDNFCCYEELLGSNRPQKVQVLESVGPRRIAVISTAMFFY